MSILVLIWAFVGCYVAAGFDIKGKSSTDKVVGRLCCAAAGFCWPLIIPASFLLGLFDTARRDK